MTAAWSRSSKDKLRQELRRRLRALPPGLFHEEGLLAAKLLRGHPLWERFSTILIFLSADAEIATAPLLEAALEAGKAVFAPQVWGEELRFWRIPSAAGPWEEGPFGLREPRAGPGGALGEGDFPALVLCPGLGFDRRGGRLGRGRGFYDRFLAALDRPERGLPPIYTALGLCVPAQVIPQVPQDPLDRPMDGLCTGEELLLLKAPR